MPKPNRARAPGRNPDLYADPKTLADEIVGKGPVAEMAGMLTKMWGQSVAPFAALWDTVAPSIGDAIADIRNKFEEFAWGREVTRPEIDVTHEPPSADMRMTFRQLVEMQAAMLPNTPDRADQARHEPEVDGPDM